MFFGAVGLLATCLFPGVLLSDFFLEKRKSLFEYLSLSVLLSLSLNFFPLLYLSVFHSLTSSSLVALLVLESVAIIGYRKKKRIGFRMPSLNARRFSLPEFFSIAFVIVVLTLQFIASAFFPFVSYDAIASYNNWATDIYQNGKIANFDYPQFLSAIYSWVYFFGGADAQNFAHLIVFLSGLAGLYYIYRLTEELGGSGFLACALVLLTGWLLVHFNSGYSDLLLFSVSAAILYYLDVYLKEGATKHLLLLGFFAGIAAIVKIQGIYVPLGLALALMAQQQLSGKKFNEISRKAGLLILVSIAIAAQWYALDFMSGKFYLTDSFTRYSSEGSSISNWVDPELSENYLARPMAGLVKVYENTTPPLAVFLLAGVVFGAYSLARRDSRLSPLVVFSFVYLLFWSFFLAFLLRGLAVAYPGLLVLSSVSASRVASVLRWKTNWALGGVAAKSFVLVVSCALSYFLIVSGFFSVSSLGFMGCFKKEVLPGMLWVYSIFALLVLSVIYLATSLRNGKEPEWKTTLALSLVPLLLYSAFHMAYFSLMGTTVGCIRVEPTMLPILLEGNPEKLAVSLGSFYGAVQYIMENPEIRESSLLTFDARARFFLRGYNISAESPDYVLFKDVGYRGWNTPPWAGTEVDEDLTDNKGKYFTELYSSEPYVVYKVNKTAVDEFLKKQETSS